MNLKNKVAIVTGAQRGIGQGISLKLAELGAKVVVTDMTIEPCEKVVQEIIVKGGEAVAFKLDVTSESEVKDVIAQVKEKFGQVDILVNNAGICTTEEADDTSKIDKIVDVDIKGVLYCSKAVLPIMIEQKYGKIVNIASIAGYVSWAKLHSYSAAKGAVISLTKCMAGEFAGMGININAVAPGAIQTPMLDNVGKELGMDMSQTLMAIPKARIGTPEDIANAVAFLVSDEADYIVGQTLIVDGGYTVR
ncbi:SDR family oxidoreductase [Patescibacteria group bacterium]|nr:SDR family oxidoreductase [Patescibacteria group bacterium]MBU4023456.1 SDR family oxidoreductase [Patescibacteria group bacterium]MBU4078046.1 SDR family oxidoreductase [Patescibacteria group bacterium]